MKKILLSLAAVGAVAGVAIASSGAFFSDTETSVDNTFQAGAVDVKIDSQCHYFQDGSEVGCNDFGTWTSGDLSQEKFFSFADVKPGDWGENTISLTVENNPAWACMQIGNMTNNENTLTDPEQQAGDTTSDPNGGELAQNLHFTAWLDQGTTAGWQGHNVDSHEGDNIWDGPTDEPLLFSNQEGPASDVLGGKTYTLADASGGFGPLQGNVTNYIGLQWCAGDMTISGSTITCDGSTMGNESQTDSLTADVSFYAVQSRNNAGFLCSSLPPLAERPLVGAKLADYQTPNDCTNTLTNGADVQAAINTANNNDKICLDDGTYHEFVVNKPLTIAGLTNPNTGSAKIVPSGPGVTELAYVTSSDVTIEGLHFDGTSTIFTGNQAAGIQVSPNGGAINNVHIQYNIVENLAATNPNAANKGIQWHDGNSGNSLTNSSFTNNVINNITSTSKGGYGVQTVGDTDGLDISYNTISNISGAWGAGIALDSNAVVNNTNTSINHNQVVTGIWGPTFPVSVQVEHNIDQTGVVVNYNNLGGLVHGSGTAASAPDVNAENNWWGDTSPADNVFGPVDYAPFATSPFTLN